MVRRDDDSIATLLRNDPALRARVEALPKCHGCGVKAAAILNEWHPPPGACAALGIARGSVLILKSCRACRARGKLWLASRMLASQASAASADDSAAPATT
jgi:hypothetical protein